jgi:lactam utilization protein B
MKVDQKYDMSESFGHYQPGSEADIMRHINSINIVCGLRTAHPDLQATENTSKVCRLL